MYFSKPTGVAPVKDLEKPRDRFIMPSAGDDPQFEYVLAVRPDAPFEFITIGGECFPKKIYPPEASLVTNQDKRYDAGVLVRMLTEKQASALKTRAKTFVKKIGSRQNPDWKPDSEEPEYFPAYKINALDYIILSKKEEFDPIKTFYVPQGPAEPEKDESEKAEEAIYNTQGKQKRRGK